MVSTAYQMKRNNIISAFNKRVRITNSKYGIKIPRDKKEAIKLDTEKVNSVWQDAIYRK